MFATNALESSASFSGHNNEAPTETNLILVCFSLREGPKSCRRKSEARNRREVCALLTVPARCHHNARSVELFPIRHLTGPRVFYRSQLALVVVVGVLAQVHWPYRAAANCRRAAWEWREPQEFVGLAIDRLSRASARHMCRWCSTGPAANCIDCYFNLGPRQPGEAPRWAILRLSEVFINKQTQTTATINMSDTMRGIALSVSVIERPSEWRARKTPVDCCRTEGDISRSPHPARLRAFVASRRNCSRRQDERRLGRGSERCLRSSPSVGREFKSR